MTQQGIPVVHDGEDVNIAEYLPFDEERLSRMFGKLKLFSQRSV